VRKEAKISVAMAVVMEILIVWVPRNVNEPFMPVIQTVHHESLFPMLLESVKQGKVENSCLFSFL